ncbi:peptidoglycan recognition family protein [Runella sp. MFBS21]|uniref:N-acetylmuramoyl-L-alanine amidase n=1 Tax=Runella sp. MFBS21 TaxID=3034018 RepID=UPI0023F8369F|nr:peptidoglycan recognition family protein [Runella sp. MFBS21]MDF7816671.1 peptidoglycan recognition family protein [Runella sp. MFBS21]
MSRLIQRRDDWLRREGQRSIDYSSAIFLAAGSGHFTPGRSLPISLIVLHVTGSHDQMPHEAPPVGLSAMNMFRSEHGNTSAHYIIDRDGTIIQMVRERDTAHHATNYNRNSIGIEHVSRYDLLLTEIQFRKSVELVSSLCQKYSIPVSRNINNGICAHGDLSKKKPHCGTGSWNWERYLLEIQQRLATI